MLATGISTALATGISTAHLYYIPESGRVFLVLLRIATTMLGGQTAWGKLESECITAKSYHGHSVLSRYIFAMAMIRRIGHDHQALFLLLLFLDFKR